MRLSKTLVDMDMADYSAALDPAYTTLEFENVQVLTMGNGRWGRPCPGAPAGGRSAQGRERVCGAQFGAGRRMTDEPGGPIAEPRCCQEKQICPGRVTLLPKLFPLSLWGRESDGELPLGVLLQALAQPGPFLNPLGPGAEKWQGMSCPQRRWMEHNCVSGCLWDFWERSPT